MLGHLFGNFLPLSRGDGSPRTGGREQPLIVKMRPMVDGDRACFSEGRRWSRARLGGMVVLLMFVAAVVGVHTAQQATLAERLARGPNTWTARSTSGVTLTGTWTAVIDEKTTPASGTWTLSAADGRTVARGTWSAAKSSSAWSGAWRARSAGSTSEYAGTWSAGVDLVADAPIARLFEHSMKAVVSGRWRAGSQTGGWSIRAFD